MRIGLSAPCWHGGAQGSTDTPRCRQEDTDGGRSSTGTPSRGHNDMGIDSLSGTVTCRDTDAHACSDNKALQMKWMTWSFALRPGTQTPSLQSPPYVPGNPSPS